MLIVARHPPAARRGRDVEGAGTQLRRERGDDFEALTIELDN